MGAIYSKEGLLMQNTESMEMYLETIFVLETNHGHAHSVEIAKKLGVSKPSVTKAMRQLKDKGYINKETYGSITLTDEGRALSKSVYRRHKQISQYLVHSLGISSDEADRNACRMEHVLTDEMQQAIRAYLEENHLEAAEITV